MNQDWEKWGRDIRNIVQDAVDSQDFQRLNETISNTVNDAIFNLRQNIRRGPGGPQQWGAGPGDFGNRADRTDLAADRRPDPAADMSAGRRKSRFCLQRKAALPWRGRLFLQWAFSLRFAAWAPSLPELCLL